MKKIHCGSVLLYFVKHPESGKAKNRLVPVIGMKQLVGLYRNLAELNLKILRTAENSRVVICFDPPEMEKSFRSWFKNEGASLFWPQQGEGLGERIQHGFREAFGQKAERVLAIGSETLGLSRIIIQKALLFLEDRDVVIGPARHGGYYLLGMSREIPALFEKIPWSASKSFQTALEIIRDQGLSHELLPEREGLDTADHLTGTLRQMLGIPL